MTSVLEYLQLLKQINNVPPEVQAVATNDLEEIKKRKIYIPNATIRKSVYRGNKQIERYDELETKNNRRYKANNKKRERETKEKQLEQGTNRKHTRELTILDPDDEYSTDSDSENYRETIYI